MNTQHLNYSTCYAEYSENILTVGNRCVEHQWIVGEEQLYPRVMYDRLQEYEWLHFPNSNSQPAANVTISLGDSPGVKAEAAALVVDVYCDQSLLYCVQIWPDMPGVFVQRRVVASQTSTDFNHQVSVGIEQTPDGITLNQANLVAAYAPNGQHLRLTQVNLVDLADDRNEFVQECEWLLHPCESVQLKGNLFILENTITQRGLIFIKHDLLPRTRPDDSFDFCILPDTTGPVSTHSPQYLHYLVALYDSSGAGWSILPFDDDMTSRLHAYQRLFRVPIPGREAVLLSNTWGNRARDGRINEAFIMQEIEAAARLGVEVVQIDDGWQKGTSANSVIGSGVWAGFWNTDEAFWEPHPDRLPRGFDPIIDAARRHDIQIGLWYAPDSYSDFINWERDASVLLNFYHRYDIRYFKLDSIDIRSSLGRKRLHALLDRVYENSDGKAVCELDLTAGRRPAYFNAMRAGTLFVENRYTDWRTYYPHHTLRNLWQLAHFIDPLRLRVEFLDHTRNCHLYPDDPLAPEHYAPDYLFATTMFANPLVWLELSELPVSFIDSCSRLITVWKAHRERLLCATIYPIGDKPDGTTWTGFWACGEDYAYLLAFREYNPDPDWTFYLPISLLQPCHTQILAGSGKLLLFMDTQVKVSIPSRQSYLFAQFVPEPERKSFS